VVGNAVAGVAALAGAGLVAGLQAGLMVRSSRTGNDPASTMANALVEGVAERVELCDGDAR
jgi:hypothetical protein